MAEIHASPRSKASIGVLVATVFGIGYLRPGPGTWASLAAGLCAWPVCVSADPQWSTALLVAGALLSGVIGLAVSPAAMRHFGCLDPSQVVIDEVLGTWAALACIPPSVLQLQPGTAVITAVIAFRVFDIAKPWPVSWFERLPGGWGIMADDLVAGLFAGAFSAAVLH